MRSYLVFFLLIAPFCVAQAQDEDWDDWEGDSWSESDAGAQWSGFVEAAFGTRWDKDPAVSRRQTLGDIRFRAESQWQIGKATVSVKGEAWYDQYLKKLEGEIRDLTLVFSPLKTVDMTVGRQVLTWGTGDLVFLNDLFPKDWVSFFAGRDDEFLKAPSNAVRFTWYSDFANLDVAWTPVFESDVFLNGERFSFFSPLAGARIAPDPPLSAVEPDKTFDNGELALRLFKTIEGNEYALYAYHGFFHQPSALDENLRPTFAPLFALGGSLRRSLGAGLFNAEVVYYASRDDRSGTDPRRPNDQARFLLGYEREVMTNLTLAAQIYIENTRDYDALIRNSPVPQLEPDEYRQVATGRLTYRALQDKLILSMFAFYSPSDDDYYLRPVVTYRYSDEWSFTGGANVFGGADTQTFFNQFADNSNVYLRVRYHY